MNINNFYSISNNKKNIIFDFDETLITLHLPWIKFQEGVRLRIAQIDKGMVEDYGADRITLPLINEAIEKHGDKVRDVINNWCLEFETNYLEGYTKNTELLDFIQNSTLNKNFYIWSSNMFPTIENILLKENLNNIFKKIITRDKVKFTKPADEGFYLIIDSKNQSKNDFLMVGDSSNDQLAAEEAGIDFFKVEKFI